jgi:diguanylate cyclase (GGDEF)-like protein/PAS domain S-box-containing protein
MPRPASADPPGRPHVTDSAHALLPDLEVKTLLDQLPAILYVAEVGIEGRWRYVSRGVEAILGFTPAEWIADPGSWARQVHEEDRDRVFDREGELANPTVPEEYRMRHRHGRVVWVRDEAALVRDAQGNACWHGVMSDITDRKLAEAELERRAEQQAAVARFGKHALEGASLTELMDEALGEASRITGAQAAAVIECRADGAVRTVRAGAGRWGQMMLERSEPAPDEQRRARDSATRAEPAADPADGASEYQLRGEPHDGVSGLIDGKEGRWGELWLIGSPSCPLGPADADFVQAIANILADAIQRRATEEDIRYQAVHDPLTGLPNRVLFLERLGEALARRAAEVAVVLLDIDNFKLVNDSLGHAAGDELLMQIAPRLQSALRPEDLIARFGGDEFVMLLEDIGDDRAAAQVAERIVTAFELPFDLRANEHFAKVSVGIALANRAGRAPAGLIRDADAALYHAKDRGRARFEVFDHMMRTRTVERLSLENDLRRALDRDQLHVVYQPVVSLRDRSIRSLEALLRWQHPERGLINPMDFIPVAEECGMIEPIGQWVLETACAQAARWQATYPQFRSLGISVNLSVRQFKRGALETTVANALALTGVQPSSLSLEITESVLMEEPHRFSETIKHIAPLGVRFILDDFGTGYSSLAYLSGLPIDGLKVDRSFVEMIGRDERSTAITTAIVRMAQALSVEVIAEGVENERQFHALRHLGCELAQGYYLSPPLSVSALAALLEDGRARALGRAKRAISKKPGRVAATLSR